MSKLSGGRWTAGSVMARGFAEVSLAVFAIVLIAVGAVLTAPVSYRLAR